MIASVDWLGTATEVLLGLGSPNCFGFGRGKKFFFVLGSPRNAVAAGGFGWRGRKLLLVVFGS